MDDCLRDNDMDILPCGSGNVIHLKQNLTQFKKTKDPKSTINKLGKPLKKPIRIFKELAKTKVKLTHVNTKTTIEKHFFKRHFLPLLRNWI